MNSPTPYALQITELSLVYPGANADPTRALDRLSLDVAAGQVYGLLGKPGSGKTSLLRAVSGRLKPQSGRIAIFGREQSGQPSPDLCVWLQDDLQPDPFIEAVHEPERRAELHALARALEISPAALSRISSLPFVLQERARLIPALLNDRPLILLDELPGLTPETAALLHDWLPDAIHSRGQTLILATHFPAIIHKLCDRAAVLDRGSLVYEGPVNRNPGPIAKARYTIRLGGRIASTHTRLPAGLTVQSQGNDTLISGEFADQAALYGLIGCARDLGLTLLSVERQEGEHLDPWSKWGDRD